MIARLRKLSDERRDLAVDLILLVPDFSLLKAEPSPEFQKALTGLGEFAGPEFGLSLYDEEGLALAKRLALERLPALVIEQRGRTHVAYGSAPDIEELLRCSK